jgi:hypothetical protein
VWGVDPCVWQELALKTPKTWREVRKCERAKTQGPTSPSFCALPQAPVPFLPGSTLSVAAGCPPALLPSLLQSSLQSRCAPRSELPDCVVHCLYIELDPGPGAASTRTRCTRLPVWTASQRAISPQDSLPLCKQVGRVLGRVHRGREGRVRAAAAQNILQSVDGALGGRVGRLAAPTPHASAHDLTCLLWTCISAGQRVLDASVLLPPAP